MNAPKIITLRDAIRARRPAVSTTTLPARLPAPAPDASQLARAAYDAVVRAEHAHAVDDVEGLSRDLATARASLARLLTMGAQ